jgi:hypothetical protein
MSGKSKGADDYPWLADSLAAAVAEILGVMEVPEVDPQARRALQRIYYRRNKFHGDGAGHLTLLIRSISESEANGIPALVEPVILAIHGVMRPEWTGTGLRWLEAFDQIDLMSILETMRSFGIFSEQSISRPLECCIWNKLIKIFQPAKATPVKREPVIPASVRRIPATERRIQRGVELLELRATHKHNAAFGAACLNKFNMDGKDVSDAMRVARNYCDKPAIYTKLSWAALLALSYTMPAATRAVLETRIRSGERIAAGEIRRARRARAARADGTLMAA